MILELAEAVVADVGEGDARPVLRHERQPQPLDQREQQPLLGANPVAAEVHRRLHARPRFDRHAQRPTTHPSCNNKL